MEKFFFKCKFPHFYIYEKYSFDQCLSFFKKGKFELQKNEN